MRLFQALVAVLAFAATARADVKLHPLFTDNMVLQQGVEVPIWGKANPEEKVTVELARLIAAAAPVTVQATADKEGKWMVKLPKQAVGTGFTLPIKGANTTTLNN